jgi:hypothetical protein
VLKSYRADTAQFSAALNIAVIALTTSLLMRLGVTDTTHSANNMMRDS